jgi:hypothetical protein
MVQRNEEIVTMTYRNDLDAAHYRIEQLEREVKNLSKKKKVKRKLNMKKVVPIITKIVIGLFILSLITGVGTSIICGCESMSQRKDRFLQLCKAAAPKGSWGHYVISDEDCTGCDARHECRFFVKDTLGESNIEITRSLRFEIPAEAGRPDSPFFKKNNNKKRK